MPNTTIRTRDVALRTWQVRCERQQDGGWLVRPVDQLGDYPRRLTERLEHWARVTPERAFLAERAASGAWQIYTYAETLAAVRALGQAILDRDLSVERPIAILSGNSIAHALLGLAAMHVGVPYAPISPAYSLVATDYARLRHIMGVLTPGLIFADDGAAFAAAIAATAPEGCEIVAAHPRPGMTAFADLLARTASGAVAAAAAKVGPDTIAKFLFTSGSTALPKGVINTQRMLCSNQQMLVETYPVLVAEPPVIVDWLPWNHTFGGNHNVGLVLNNGGTLYIDDGRPMPGAIEATVRNLREIAPTVYFNVPKGYEELVPYLRRERALRETFFSRLRMMFYAGAGLAQPVWDSLDALAVQTCGERIVMLTGLGSTETAPFALACSKDYAASGMVGLPVPGVELRLAPVQGKLEGRVRGPNITPGYWRDEARTRAAFDELGFYKFGDALAFVDETAPFKGFRFEGRISEDFKLSTGTWVSVGPLRAALITALTPLVRDVVVAGENRDYVAILALPDVAACRALVADRDASAPDSEILADHRVRARIADALAEQAGRATGSSNRVRRALLLTTPPSLDRGEITDKGSLNQRAMLDHRAADVAALYADPPSADVIIVEGHQ